MQLVSYRLSREALPVCSMGCSKVFLLFLLMLCMLLLLLLLLFRSASLVRRCRDAVVFVPPLERGAAGMQWWLKFEIHWRQLRSERHRPCVATIKSQ